MRLARERVSLLAYLVSGETEMGCCRNEMQCTAFIRKGFCISSIIQSFETGKLRLNSKTLQMENVYNCIWLFFVCCNIILHLKWMKEQVLFVFKKIKIGNWQHRILKWFKTPERPVLMVIGYSLFLSCERLRVVGCMWIKEFKVKPPSGRRLHHMQTCKTNAFMCMLC